MANFWCVEPAGNSKELSLSYMGRDFKIVVKRELTVGEQRSIQTAGFRSLRKYDGADKAQDKEQSTEIGIDWNRQSFARTLVYLIDWTLADENGNKMPISRETVEGLREPVYQVIEEAIGKHVEAMEEARKNAPGGPERLATSA